jgi:hypothetical protein
MTLFSIDGLTHLTSPALADKMAVEPDAGLPLQYSTVGDILAITKFIGSGTWAGRPTASTNTGNRYWATDIGLAGAMFVSDGTSWTPPYRTTLARSAIKISIPNNTILTEQTYVTVTVPAGLMGLNSAIYVEALWSYTASTNTKTMRARFGGIGGSVIVSILASTGTFLTSRGASFIRNRNVANSQTFPPTGSVGNPIVATSGVNGTAAVDTASSVDIVFTGTLAVSGEAIDLESYEVRLLP